MISRQSDTSRETVHLWIAISIVLVLSAYRLTSSLFSELESFFEAYTELPIAETLVNSLFFWLLALLWVAYRRWRSTIAHTRELERVLTSISPDSIAVINPDRKITMCSGQIESMFGYTFKELIGESTDVLYYDRRVRGEPGEIANRLEEVGFHVGYASGKRRDGKSFPLEIITGTIKGERGAVLLMRDITERCNTEDALRESEARFELFMQYLPGAAFVKDADGKFIYMNATGLQMCDLTPTDYTTKTDYDIYPPTLADQFAEEEKRILRDNRENRALIRTLHEDSPRAVQTYKFPIPAQDQSRPMIGGIAMDVTEQENAENERRKIEKQMQQAQKLESLGVLGGGIAHDFNNLLMGMLGHADLALTQLPEEALARQNIEEVITSAQRAADLANQLLAYSGEGKFLVETVSLSLLVGEMSNLIEVSISKKAMLQLNLDQSIPAIRCDVTQIRQIIMNLIVNASDALEEESGNITLTTGLTRAAINSDDTYLGSELPEGEYVFARISDTGCGMDEDTRARIFDPFYTTKFAGRGLGLAAVMGIVKNHDGAISLESEPEKGTTFTVYLPAVADKPKPRPVAGAESDAWQGSGMVLIADDEVTVRNVARMMLENIGFEVMTVENGRKAVDMIKDYPERFTAALIDLTMPELGGLEAYQEIRAMNSQIPVVLSSGYNKKEEFKNIADPHPPLFLKKPYRLDSIRAIFKSLLDE
ncbi:MAG: PAS domain S-box protein [Verrucomicrobia bacterium]|jgi:two-component system, cell cycle sensor histidine kinase and response regulator CckA|nr:PAS domain S-box protein [Verrucomicrobiota bacterium]